MRKILFVLILIGLMAISVSATLPDVNVRGLLYLNGTNTSTTITDETGKIWYPSGTAEILTTQSKFGGASAYFDGSTTSRIETSNTADIQLADDKNWSFDAWVYPTGFKHYGTITGTRMSNSGAFGWTIYTTTTSATASTIQVESDTEFFVSSYAIPTDTWTHIAVEKEASDVVKLYINGIYNGTKSFTSTGQQTNISIGNEPTGSSSAIVGFTGYIDQVRISNETVYFGNFTPDATEYVYPTSSSGDPPAASFTASNTSGIYPPALPVRFTDTSTNTPTSWEWNFTNTTGNNTAVTFATTQNPLWYFDIGNYSISLNATNSYGSDVSDQVTWINVSAPTTLSLAEFTGMPLSGTAPLSVTFTDSDGTGETSWSWIFGDGNTTGNTLQNPVHLYTASGTYTVNHSATNSIGTNWTNKTGYITVVNASGFTPQDIWMEGQYIQTFHITDSSTGLPIPIVQLQDTAMQTFTTTNGTGYLTEEFGPSTVVFMATGYNSKAVSYFFDSEATHTVQLVASSPGGTQNTWYTPWQVRIRIVDYYGMPLNNINVTANYIASSLPSTDTTWLVSAFGINTDVANDMLNSSVAMAGNTDDNGGLSFTMFKSIQYRLTITNTTLSVASTKTLYPSDQEYVIYVRTAGQTAANNTLAMRNGTLPWYSVNSTHINLNMTYVDTSLCTNALTFRVWFRDNGTEVHNTTWSGFGAGFVYDNHTVPKAPIGTEYLWGYNATTVC